MEIRLSWASLGRLWGLGRIHGICLIHFSLEVSSSCFYLTHHFSSLFNLICIQFWSELTVFQLGVPASLSRARIWLAVSCPIDFLTPMQVSMLIQSEGKMWCIHGHLVLPAGKESDRKETSIGKSTPKICRPFLLHFPRIKYCMYVCVCVCVCVCVYTNFREIHTLLGFPGNSAGKESPVWFLSWEDLLEKG